MRVLKALVALVVVAASSLGLQGCVLAAAGAGAAGGYAAHEEGYRVQSPVKKDEAGDHKGQPPVTHEERADETPEAGDNP